MKKTWIFIPIRISGRVIEWEKVDTIQDPSIGLQGYTLKNEDTGEIVISFKGTQLYRGVDQVSDINEDFFGIVLGGPDYTKREQNTVRYNGSPGQDARINNGTARLNKDGTL
ncbi:hypothetical protein P5G51_000370 [Virgibacillus sp. 179-BFC.A HS]|uniref:Uncharacterized protein n=1 Tax=Tigheibacillus jepli TaxID=3035914 RepID=A0ABU5CCL9_9BACI|nr:hypothetical protein [Virgibacillus sp. 179-BFC.A HS]MDY0404070.1 hypothetical protein [Virgibacillus sp. 179-BFC.A HS]